MAKKGKRPSGAPVKNSEDPPLPVGFLENMQRLLGSEYPAFLESYSQSPSVGLRVNTLKTSPEDFRAVAPFELDPVPWSPAGFLVTEREGAGTASPGKHPYHAAGLHYLQDPSAMAVAEMLQPQPGELVLDLSAAPGGKATHLASLMQNHGLLVANEIHPRRVWELAENLERWGVRNAAIANDTPERLVDTFGDFFDRVLVDAPCSGEGMFRKSPPARGEWSPGLVESCALRQAGILDQAARLVRPGGQLLYSTCTFSPQENEAAVARFLEAHPDFELQEPAEMPGAEPGRAEWAGSNLAVRSELRKTRRFWPHRSAGEGHFAALLGRDGSRSTGEVQGRKLPPLPREAARLYHDFCREHLTSEPAGERLFLSGSYLYQLPAGLLEPGRLRFAHPGWWLGTLKKDRFEPAQALAMGLKSGAARRAAHLDAGGPEVQAYLRGETLDEVRVRGEKGDGWVLVTVDGFPLGWGKSVQGRIKNYYPRGLRWK